MNYYNGNLFDRLAQIHGHPDHPNVIIMHGCNCQGVMGAGFADQVKRRFPEAYAADKRSACVPPSDKLGKFTFYTYPEQGPLEFTWLTVVNLYTQLIPGPNVDYDALRSAFVGAKLTFDTDPDDCPYFLIPAVGAGIGGGDWEKIEKIVKEVGFRNIECCII